MSASRSVLATVFQEVRPEADLRALRNDLPLVPADDGTDDLAGEGAELELLRLRRLQRAVAQDDVREFVRHHAGNLVVGARRLEHPPIEEHRAARQRKRVDLAQVYDIE